MIGGNHGLSLHNGRVFRLAHEIFKQCAIVNHGATQILSARLSFALAKSDLVRCAVILRNDGMLYRNVRRALVEVAHRIAAGCHQIADQLIGFGDRTGRRIDKVSLYTIPLLRIPTPVLCRKRAKVKLLYALGPVHKRGLRATAIATFGNGAIILGAEVLTKLLCPSTLQIESYKSADNHHDDRNDEGYLDGG